MSQNNIITLKQIKEAKRLFKAYEITEGSAGDMTLQKMLAIVIEQDRKSAAEDAKYFAQNPNPRLEAKVKKARR